MEPVMKIDRNGVTQYLFHTERVLEILDVGKPEKPAAIMYFDNSHEVGHWESYRLEGVTARYLKRTIQDNASDKVGFLKLDYNTETHGKGARRYVNVDWIMSIRALNFTKTVDGQKVTVGGALIRGKDLYVHVEGAPFAVAAQVRRVLKRLDQDEEFCCDAPEPEAETDDSE